MAESADTTPPERRCAECGGTVHVRSPHVIVDRTVVRSYCSPRCFAIATTPAGSQSAARRWLGHLMRAAVAIPILLIASGPDLPPPVETAAPPSAPATAPAPEPPRYGPAWPPSEQDWLAEIAADAWIHPLDGPRRRMPISDSRVFGAERPGERPGECRNGHCGVDLAGPWGEAVHAAHDGIVDRVQRGPNEEHGGLYVRLAHRDGTILTQYFHLAAIPHHIQPGVRVKVGEVIGLLGDSGIKRSEPHLHFALSVRPSANVTERYIDPEPLIALWPLRIPVGDASGILTAEAAPGIPLGAALKRHAHRSVAHASFGAVSATE